jgi:MoxR-like ATPase
MDCTAETMAQDVIGRTKLRQENGATVSDWTPGPLAKAFNDPKGALSAERI